MAQTQQGDAGQQEQLTEMGRGCQAGREGRHHQLPFLRQVENPGPGHQRDHGGQRAHTVNLGDDRLAPEGRRKGEHERRADRYPRVQTTAAEEHGQRRHCRGAGQSGDDIDLERGVAERQGRHDDPPDQTEERVPRRVRRPQHADGADQLPAALDVNGRTQRQRVDDRAHHEGERHDASSHFA